MLRLACVLRRAYEPPYVSYYLGLQGILKTIIDVFLIGGYVLNTDLLAAFSTCIEILAAASRTSTCSFDRCTTRTALMFIIHSSETIWSANESNMSLYSDSLSIGNGARSCDSTPLRSGYRLFNGAWRARRTVRLDSPTLKIAVSRRIRVLRIDILELG